MYITYITLPVVRQITKKTRAQFQIVRVVYEM